MVDQSKTGETFSKQPRFWGRFTPFVLLIVLIGVAADQGTKLWLVYGFDLGANGPVRLLPILDIVLVWNRGISYGLFQQHSDVGRWLLVVVTAAITIGLWIWSARCQSRLIALALALVIGGAIGNGIDRLAFGAVVDFIYFHAGSFSWYVFNLADVWIVAGVAGLLYDSFRNGPNSAAK